MTTTKGSAAALAILVGIAFTAPASASPQAPDPGPPPELFAPVGTVLTVQIQDRISSDRNLAGDGFLAVLGQPLVIDGWVVARPGQTVFGRVVSANNAGRVKGTSDLAIELTEMMLVDGQQAPIRTQLLKNYGRDSHTDDVTAIAGATALGTLIGVAVGHGKGAAIGAGVGAAAATVGVLSTRGKATEIYPESSMTFRLDAPLIVSTVRSRQAFLPVVPEDYDRAPSLRTPPGAHPQPVQYPPVYDPYPPRRFPRSRVGVLGPVIVIPPIIINNRGHRRWDWFDDDRYWRR